jgi:hypothetical protein
MIFARRRHAIFAQLNLNHKINFPFRRSLNEKSGDEKMKTSFSSSYTKFVFPGGCFHCDFLFIYRVNIRAFLNKQPQTCSSLFHRSLIVIIKFSVNMGFSFQVSCSHLIKIALWTVNFCILRKMPRRHVCDNYFFSSRSITIAIEKKSLFLFLECFKNIPCISV